MTKKIVALLLAVCMMLCVSACSFNEETVSQPTFKSTSNLVWIPTKVGTKYHNNPNCSNMKGPIQVTKETAIREGFEPCKNCY